VSHTALPPDLPGSLDAVHLRIRDAFSRRDLAAYGRHVAEDLTYVDPRGRVQNRPQLLRSVRRQLARLVSFSSHFERESLILENADAVETGTQTAAIAIRVFAVFEVRWRVTRHGRYTWRRDTEAAWVLRHVLLDQEQVRRDGVGLADRASYGQPPDHGAA
jgi:hypothetical protein